MVRLEDINELKDICKLERIKILSQDGPSDYIRPIINKMDDETFELYIKYHDEEWGVPKYDDKELFELFDALTE